MPRSVFVLLFALLVPARAFSQPLGGAPAMPLAVDLKKAEVGTWAEYDMSVERGIMKSRWALVGRDAQNVTIEMEAEGGPPGKMVVQMVLAPDPTTTDRPVRKLVVQMGAQDPMELPTSMPGVAGQKFEKPDPKSLVGKETIKVTAGSFKTKHYRRQYNGQTVDVWVSEDVPPMGIIRAKGVGGTGPGGQPLNGFSMELRGHGKGAKPAVTKPPRPFNPALLGGPPPPPPPSAPPPAPPAK